MDSEIVEAHSFFTKLFNRNYVRPELNVALNEIAKRFNSKHPGIKVIYLDANFPFIDKFPLLPHLSHNDGKKLDLSLVYQDVSSSELVNDKPSISGYGIFEKPRENEYNQTEVCKSSGKWQYDFTKYFSFGRINRGSILYSNNGTRDLMREIIQQPHIKKIFIEPHLRQRMGISNNKVRFHGCQAVRHDDHIHVQL